MFSTPKGPRELCPLLNGACVKEQCRLWASTPVEDLETKVPSMREDCALFLSVAIARETAVWSRGGQKATEGLRNAVVRQTGDDDAAAKRIQDLEQQLVITQRQLVATHRLAQATVHRIQQETHATGDDTADSNAQTPELTAGPRERVHDPVCHER